MTDKIKVPKFFDSWYKENELDTPLDTIAALVEDIENCVLDDVFKEYYSKNHIELAYAILEGYVVG